MSEYWMSKDDEPHLVTHQYSEALRKSAKQCLALLESKNHISYNSPPNLQTLSAYALMHQIFSIKSRDDYLEEYDDYPFADYDKLARNILESLSIQTFLPTIEVSGFPSACRPSYSEFDPLDIPFIIKIDVSFGDSSKSNHRGILKHKKFELQIDSCFSPSESTTTIITERFWPKPDNDRLAELRVQTEFSTLPKESILRKWFRMVKLTGFREIIFQEFENRVKGIFPSTCCIQLGSDYMSTFRIQNYKNPMNEIFLRLKSYQPDTSRTVVSKYKWYEKEYISVKFDE